MPLLLSLAWRNSASRPQRSLLSALAVGLGVSLILATQLTSSALRVQLTRATQALVGKSDAEVFAFSDSGFSPGMLDAVKALPEVDLAAPVIAKRLIGRIPDPANKDRSITETFQLYGIDPVSEQRLHPLTVEPGSALRADDKAAVLLDRGWAQDHNLGVGSKLVLFTSTGPDEYRVAGLVQDSAFVQSSFGPVVFVPLAQAQGAFQLGARVTQISVALKPRASYETFRSDLRLAATDEYTVRDNHAFVGGQRDPYLEIQPVLVFFSVLALAIGLFLIYNNLAVTVLERRREIGLLRAAGATPGWVRALFVVQALLLGLAGAVVGIVAGVGLAVVLVLYLASASGQNLTFVFDPLTAGLVVVLGIVATLVCAVLPAIRASRVAPLDAIRPDQPLTETTRGFRSLILGLFAYTIAAVLLVAGLQAAPQTGISGRGLFAVAVGVALTLVGTLLVTPILVRPITAVAARPLRWLAPAETLLSINAIRRRPNRTALTIAGLIVSSALVISVAGLSQGALGAGDRWVDSLFVSDHLLVSPVRQSDAVRQEIAKIKGVATTSPIAFVSVRAGDRALSLASIDPLEYAARNTLEFEPGTGVSPYSDLQSGRAMFISRRLAASRNLRPGSTLTLTTGTGEVRYRVAAIVAHSLPSPGGDEAALVSLTNGREDFAIEGFNILQVIKDPGAPADFDKRLSDAASSYGMQLESLEDVRRGVRQGLNALLILLTGVGLVGVVLGLLSVVETILLNISESGRELALLRAVGATRGQVQRIVLTQSGIFGFTGALLGLLVGLALVAVLVRAASSLGFEPSYEVPWTVVVAVAAVAVVGSLLAVIGPARRASRASVVAAIRYE